MTELDKLLRLAASARHAEAFMVLLDAMTPTHGLARDICKRGELEVTYNGGESWTATIHSADHETNGRTAYGRSRLGAVLSLAESLSLPLRNTLSNVVYNDHA